MSIKPLEIGLKEAEKKSRGNLEQLRRIEQEGFRKGMIHGREEYIEKIIRKQDRDCTN